MTQSDLAGRAGCGEKTIRKAIRGEPVSERIISELCTALGLNSEKSKQIAISDEDHGSYTKDSYADYVGQYFVYRRSFSFPRNVVRSTCTIRWSDKSRSLCFDENQRYSSAELDTIIDHSQSGEIFISNSIGLLHLVTKAKGAIRLITLSKHRLNDSTDLTMRGIVLTQAKRPLHYQPSTAAIIFEKIKTGQLQSESKTDVTVLRPKDFDYERIYKALTEVELHVVNFATTPPALPANS